MRSPPATRIIWSGDNSEPAAQLLAEYLRPATGFQFPVEPFGDQDGLHIHLVARGNPPPDDAGFFSERYSIDVSPSGITISAETPSGLARGVQSLRQLLPPEVFLTRVEPGPWPVPCVSIKDEPRFRWRGLHLDVARHFFSVADVCRFIDLLALHRFNQFHLHLTDDQGWRAEIRKYPLLTDAGSRRLQTLTGHQQDRPRRYDGQPYGGFFSQDDIRAIVAFAGRRKIVVVPEIEMPGHAQAAIAAYPGLGSGLGAPETRCHWGVSQHIFNVEEKTISFLCDVLDEVIELFPSRFIHIGGDEAPKFEWSESARVQERMAELGIRSEEGLQSWFVGKIGKHLKRRDRRMIGWDEILQGGLPHGATVMSWQGEEGGIRAAQAGHDVVMSPCQRVYFDHCQGPGPLEIGGHTTTEQVYAYEPVPEALDPAHVHHVLGSQGQLWTEYIRGRDRLDEMTYPRACALAEVLWLPADQKDYSRFQNALEEHRRRLRILGVNAYGN